MTNMAIPIEELSHEEMGAFVVGRVYIHHYMYVYSAWIWMVPKLKMAGTSGRGSRGPAQKPKGFRRSEMYSLQLVALKIINFIDLLFKKIHFISGISYPYTEPLITHYWTLEWIS